MNIKDSIKVYNQIPRKLHPSIFMMLIFFLFKWVFNINGHENLALYFLAIVVSVSFGMWIHYMIISIRNRAYMEKRDIKIAVRYACVSMALIVCVSLVILLGLLVLIL